MSFTPTSPVTGAAVTGLTSPTYTLIADQNPAVNGKQWYVSAIGGTQTGVTTHAGSDPFTVSIYKVSNYQMVPTVTPSGSFRTSVPRNKFSMVFRKGLLPLAAMPKEPAIVRFQVDLPAGTDTADAVEIAALISLTTGLLYANATALYTSLVTNTI
jgi:hypothetical protein